MDDSKSKQYNIQLRQKADELLKNKLVSKREVLSLADSLKLIHELEVHQVELELQNHELIETRAIALENEEKYIELYDFAPIGYLTLNEDCKITQTNIEGASILGKERSKIINSNFRLYVSTNTRQKFNIFFDELATSNNGDLCEVIITNSGEDDKEVILSGLISENGINRKIAITDVTKSKKAEQELRNSEERMRLAILGIPIPIMLHDEDGKVLQLSNGWTNISGYSIDDIPTMEDWTELAYGSRNGVEIEYIDKLFEINETAQNGEWVVTTKMGQKRIWEFQTTPLGRVNAGKRVLLSMAIDITNRKQNELELIEAKNRAEESDRLKSAFLANMSHEIRTPMNGILGFTGLLKEPKLSGEAKEKYIGIIQKSGNRMLNIINDLVDISKVEAGLVEMRISNVNLKDQLDYIVNFFKEEAKTKGIEIILRTYLAQEEFVVSTDKEKLFAILTNLVKNAIKYSHKGIIEIDCRKKGSFIEFHVKDNGIGISEGRQEAIFVRFVQADIEDRNAYQGAGLGLSISKAYVEMLGGEIWVSSVENKGSVFFFTIPFNKVIIDKRSQVNKIPNLKNVNKKLKILIVEDDQTSKFLLTVTLEPLNANLLYATTGGEAVKIAKSNLDLDLIFMDIKLPDMDGYNATKEIRKFDRNIVIIAQTAHALEGERDIALANGCNNYISKPIDSNKLFSLIEGYFASS